jgi:hypothetical protein
MKGLLVKKVNSEAGDGTPDGTFGKAILSADSPESMRINFPNVKKMYCVVWDNKTGLLIATVDFKVEVIDPVPIEFEVSMFVQYFAEEYKKIMPFFNYYE